MNQDNRVLGRTRARELSVEEIRSVTGGLRTQTVCTFDEGGFRDGDVSLGEC